ncbi:MAG TPA: TetR/AcrR family transcriptional regulator [Dongiaceae bacterium]|jgi:AcrR family transcriptional regulator|nr:TetR/AcrR family transcriptional regulator [Dongiaceae bacterium]
MTDAIEIKPGPGRPRSAETHRAILAAVGAMLMKSGYPNLSIEAVAAKAGVGKQTIYRWWPAKADLVMEYLLGMSAQMPRPDTGSLIEDLRIFLLASVEGWTIGKLGPVVTALMAEAQSDRRFGDLFFRNLISVRRAALKEILARGQARRELAAGRDLELLADLIYGPLWYRLLLKHAPLDAAFIDDLLRELRLGM